LALLLLAVIVSVSTAAAQLSAASRAEIDLLLSRLEVSGCEFNRNGAWHTGADARAHLLRKLKYLEDRDAVHSAEQFIALAASASSMSGQPYLVRCAGAAPVPSREWLQSQLRSARAAAKPAQAR